jgi:hypothetical protein
VVGGSKRHQERRHVTERLKHATTSEIHSQARVDHAPVRGGSMETRLALAEDNTEHGGGRACQAKAAGAE